MTSRRGTPGQEAGWTSLLPVVVLLGTMGAVACLHGLIVLDPMGATALLGHALDRVTCRQVAPLLAALVVAAESASALAGAMVVMALQEGWAALRLLGRDPWTWWGPSALIRGSREGALLTAAGFLAFVAGGGIVLALLGRSIEPWLGAFVRPALLPDVVLGILKGAVLGCGIQALAFRVGLRSVRDLERGNGPGGDAAVGGAAGVAVVHALMFLAVAEAVWVLFVEGGA
ncbi:MAG: ABC transporter permease [Candidatus Sericytochromatia bacterium]|nr:ABC transporter permease [Candidatus Sericytochromatia bacterium]